MTEKEILDRLDNSHDGYYQSFVSLGDVYSYLIDSRLNVFSDSQECWAIVVERLGFSPRSGTIALDLHYFGNCLENLEEYNGSPISYYTINPVENESFFNSTEDGYLKANSSHWLVRGKEISLNGIDQVSVEEAARILVEKQPDSFRAIDTELYKSLPSDLNKILVVDEWYHKDFDLQIQPTMTDEHLMQTYELNKNLTGLGGMTFEQFKAMVNHQQVLGNDWNRKIWEENRPSSYETWQLLAKVIVSNSPELYQPSLQPNSNWRNWPESGSM